MKELGIELKLACTDCKCSSNLTLVINAFDGNLSGTFKVECVLPRDTYERGAEKVDDKVRRDVMVKDHCQDCFLKGEFFFS